MSLRFLARAVRAVIVLVLLAVVAVLALGLAYRVVTPVSTLMLGRWATLKSAERVAVPLDAVAPAVPLAVVASEDARFCLHGGVDWDALREVVEDEEGPSRGASTVPMQVAKNLFLWPGRSYVRKALEIPIALYLDLVWPKRRMMENYLNVAEWGEGTFGIEAAARRHFGKSARDLSRQEAALLVTALPNPKLRNSGRPSARHRNLASRLLARMNAAAPFAGCLRR
ncbi:MAG TPA: monofunctional biosynthetic peptidoglycan transglycosylase [Beijerinckiaceae bacterium]|jgi:monofunctional biosynthetic peptidoglycan transglycosylase